MSGIVRKLKQVSTMVIRSNILSERSIQTQVNCLIVKPNYLLINGPYPSCVKRNKYVVSTK